MVCTVWVRTTRWNVYRHINIKLHDRAFCVWSSCVIKWIVCSHDAKQERHFLKYAATKAILVKFYVALSTYHGSLTTKSTRENSVVWSMVVKEVSCSWTSLGVGRVHFILITTGVLKASSVFFFTPVVFFSRSDIDDCTTNVHNCDALAVCNNTVGSFHCTCIAGYEGNGTACVGERCLHV